MEVRQSPLDELTFTVRMDWTEEMEAQVEYLRVYHNTKSASKKGLGTFVRATTAYIDKCFMNSSVAQNAFALDAEVELVRKDTHTFFLGFHDREAAMLFKLTYC